MFEKVLEDESPTPKSSVPSAFGAMASFLVPKLPGGLAGSLSNEKSSISMEQPKVTMKERHKVRPPVEHKWSLPGLEGDAKDPQIFQHELIQNFSVNMFCKVLGIKSLLSFLLYFSLNH